MTTLCRIDGCTELAHNKSSLCWAHIQIGRAQLAALRSVEHAGHGTSDYDGFVKSNQSLEKYKKDLADSVKHLMRRA